MKGFDTRTLLWVITSLRDDNPHLDAALARRRASSEASELREEIGGAVHVHRFLRGLSGRLREGGGGVGEGERR